MQDFNLTENTGLQVNLHFFVFIIQYRELYEIAYWVNGLAKQY